MFEKLKGLFLKQTSNNLGSLSNSFSWFPNVRDFFTIGRENNNFASYVNEGYGKNPNVYAVVNKISRVVSSLDYKLFKGEKEVDSGDLFDIFNKPNKHQFRNEFLDNVITELETTGNAIIWANKGVGFNIPLELIVLPSKDTTLVLDTLNDVAAYDVTRFGKIRRYDAEDILHLRFNNPVNTNSRRDALMGLSPLEVGMMVYKASNNILEAEASIFENRGVIGMLTNDSEVPVLDDERERLQDSFQKRTAGSRRFGKIELSNQKLRFIQMGMSPSDLKLIESDISKLRAICNIYGLDSSLFNDPANKTFNNRLEAEKSAFSAVFIPTAEHFIVRNLYNGWLINKYFPNEAEVVLDTDGIDALKSVNKDLSDRTLSELTAGIININEAREILEHE